MSDKPPEYPVMGGNEQGAQWRMARFYIEFPYKEKSIDYQTVVREFQRWIHFSKMRSTIKDDIGTPKIRRLKIAQAHRIDPVIIGEEIPYDGTEEDS
jgi:hypothetical protein